MIKIDTYRDLMTRPILEALIEKRKTKSDETEQRPVVNTRTKLENRGKGEEKERQLPECGAVEGEEEGQRHAGEEDGCVVPWREDFARHGEVESVDKGKESKPDGRKAEKRM